MKTFILTKNNLDNFNEIKVNDIYSIYQDKFLLEHFLNPLADHPSGSEDFTAFAELDGLPNCFGVYSS